MKLKLFIIIALASWYNYQLFGLAWSQNHRTAASRDYPRGTVLRVENLANGRTVDVLVNDYITHPARQIDLSSYAFSQLAPLSRGLIKVKIEKK